MQRRVLHVEGFTELFSLQEKLRQTPPPTEAPAELPSHCYLDPAMTVLDQLQQHKPECAEQRSAAEVSLVMTTCFPSQGCPK